MRGAAALTNRVGSEYEQMSSEISIAVHVVVVLAQLSAEAPASSIDCRSLQAPNYPCPLSEQNYALVAFIEI